LIRATFDRFDVDDSGKISIDNLRNIFGDDYQGVPVEKLLKEADYLGDNMISYEEFKMFLQDRAAASTSIDVAHVPSIGREASVSQRQATEEDREARASGALANGFDGVDTA